MFNGACLSLGRRDYLGQGHRDLWFLTVTAVIKTEKLQENLLETENMHCGRDHLSLCLFLTTDQALDSTYRLPSRCACAAEGMMAGEGQSTGSQTGWSATKTGGMGSTCVCGQLCKTENSARSQS